MVLARLDERARRLEVDLMRVLGEAPAVGIADEAREVDDRVRALDDLVLRADVAQVVPAQLDLAAQRMLLRERAEMLLDPLGGVVEEFVDDDDVVPAQQELLAQRDAEVASAPRHDDSHAKEAPGSIYIVSVDESCHNFRAD